MDRLPESVAAAAIEFMQGDLVRTPRRVGHELQRELTGTWAARRGTYRILYEIVEGDAVAPEQAGAVRVVDVSHRRDAYRQR